MKLPALSPSQLQHAWQCAARCDAALTSEDWLRAFRHEPDWADGVAMARYDNGAGDHVVGFFGADGTAVLKGFDHESPVSPHAREEYGIWPGLYDGLPPQLWRWLQDEAVEQEHVTFCCWSVDGLSWQSGSAIIPDDIDDGSAWLLGMVQMDAQAFIEWGKSYYEDSFERLGEGGVRAEFNKLA